MAQEWRSDNTNILLVNKKKNRNRCLVWWEITHKKRKRERPTLTLKPNLPSWSGAMHISIKSPSPRAPCVHTITQESTLICTHMDGYTVIHLFRVEDKITDLMVVMQALVPLLFSYTAISLQQSLVCPMVIRARKAERDDIRRFFSPSLIDDFQIIIQFWLLSYRNLFFLLRFT